MAQSNFPGKPQPGKPPLMQVTQQVIHQGPLPHPAVLEHFERVFPGAAAKIFAMAEAQQKHQLEQTTKILTANIEITQRGQVFGFILGFMGIVGGIVLLFFDKSLAGFTAMLGTLGFLIGSFIYGKSREGPKKGPQAK